MKKNILLCVDVTTRLQKDACMQVGKNYKGIIRMTRLHERLEFEETLPEACERNPKLWKGELFNVSRNKQGELVVNFRRTVLEAKLDPCKYADEIFLELKRAKMELGV